MLNIQDRIVRRQPVFFGHKKQDRQGKIPLRSCYKFTLMIQET